MRRTFEHRGPKQSGYLCLAGHPLLKSPRGSLFCPSCDK